MYKTIEKLCNEHNITIGRLCKEVGISSSTFTELKSGRTKTLSFKSASRVADYFGVTVDFLLGNEKTSANNSEGFNRNTIKIAGRDGSLVERTLTDEQLDLIKKMIEQLPDADNL